MFSPFHDPSGPRRLALAQVRCWGSLLLHGVRRLVDDRSGVTSLEYAIMGVMIFVAIAGSLLGFGGGLSGMLANTFSQLANAM